MQNSIGNCRGSKGTQRLGKLTSSSFGEIQSWKVVLLFSLFFSSCSLFKKSPSIFPEDILKLKLSNAAKKVCLSSEGKGRLQFLNTKHVFNYESANNLDKKRWSLGLDIPLHGEEVLHLSWGERVSVKGAFYQRLHHSLQKQQGRKEYERLLKSYIRQFAALIDFLEDLKSSAPKSKCEGGEKGQCKTGRATFNWTGLGLNKFTITSSEDARYQFVLETSGGEVEYFQRLKITLIDNEGVGSLGTLVEMDLSLASCQ